ncbi:DUF4127 family protein [Paenibacillus chungangensis]|uniref:DUF4127 family protein n=1 Tax=Paenibacillus chungangensis TaxID=696535 RepID=A0ABW3HSI6_9BACL
MNNRTIGVIPLDNRACCFQFPKRIGAIAGYDIIHPPIEALGNFMDAGDSERSKEWIRKQAGSVSCLVLSIDQLAYGGLIASRAMDRTLEQCKELLSIIPEIKREYPNLKIAAASVLMRLSITYKNKEFLEYGMMIFKYSQLYDKVHRLGESELREELEQLRECIPAHILQEYLEARKRNHEMNKLILDWCAQGIVDYAVITQEDASPIGMHLSEQKLLMEQIYTSRIQHKAMVYPGADEAVQTLLIRMIQELEGKQARIYPRYSSTAGKLAVADFEDRPVEETVNCHILASGAVRVDHPDEADIVLIVNTPEPDDRPQDTKAYFNSRHNYWDIVQGIKHEISRGRNVAVADVAICNASDLELVQYVLEEGLYLELIAYAGWNTAGNTLGTVLGHAAARWLGMQDSALAHKSAPYHYTFMLERLLDEWAYQAQVRGEINKWIDTELGLNPNHLENQYLIVNEKVQLLMKEKFEQVRTVLLQQINRTNRDGIGVADFHMKDVRLPWNRTFEVSVVADCKFKQA